MQVGLGHLTDRCKWCVLCLPLHATSLATFSRTRVHHYNCLGQIYIVSDNKEGSIIYVDSDKEGNAIAVYI